MNTKNTIVSVLVVLLLGIGAFLFGTSQNSAVQGVSQAGVINSSAKLYSTSMAPATASATSTSILNTDSTDRGIIFGVTSCSAVGTSKTYLTGAGLAALLVNVSTSTSAIYSNGGATKALSLTIATSSAWEEQFVSSPANGAVSFVWPTGTYLNFTFNATNTAACTVGVATVSL